jgi:hypothetical protein
MQLDEQLPSITNPFSSDPPADSDTTASGQSSFDELEIRIHELLQVRCSNREVPLLFEIASQPDYEELLEFSREPVNDPEDPFLLDRESAHDSDEPLDRFGLPVLFDNLLAMPTPINPQQDAVRRWLEDATPLSPTSTLLPSPEPILGANLFSFLLSPTLVDTEGSPSSTSGDSKSETSSTPSSEYETHQSGRSNYSEDSASDFYFGPPTYVTCHPHGGVFHGDPNCPCNCGSHCDFLRKNSKSFRCECACQCHTCFQRQTIHGTTPTPPAPPRCDSLDDHLESLDLAECGAIVTAPQQPKSRMSYRAALEQQELEIHYFSGIIQGQLGTFFRFPFPGSQARLEHEDED